MGPTQQVHDELVGRERELERLATLLAGALPVALLVRGEAGIGKTSLWRATLEHASDAGFRVLASRAAEAETQLAYATIADLLGDVPLPPELPVPQRRALAVALQLEDPRDAVPQPLAIAGAVLGTVRALAGEQPVLVALDDVQWLDPSSATILGFVVRRLASERVALLVAHRTGSARNPLHDALRALRTDVVDLGGLSLGATQRLLATRLEWPVSRPLVRRIYEVSGGNPLYALELGRVAVYAGDGALTAVPRELHDLVAARVEALPEETRAYLLELASCAEAPPELSADERAAPALAAGVLELHRGILRFSHPLLSAAVYDAADPWQRRAVHAALAERAASPEERARHVAAVAVAPDPTASTVIEAGADAALARGAPVDAAALYERALELVPEEDVEAVARLGLAAASAWNSAGDGTRAYDLCVETIDRLPEGLVRAPVLVFLADNHRSESLDRADQAVRESAGDAALVARARNARSELHFAQGRIDEARRDARAAASAARAAGDRIALVRALTHDGYLGALSADPRGLALLEEATALERDLEEERRPTAEELFYGPACALAVVRIWHDELDEARATLARLAADAAALGHEPVRHALLIHLLKGDWRAGDREALERNAALAVEIQVSARWEDRGSAGWAASLAAAHAGALDEARAQSRAGIVAAEANGNRMFVLQNRAILGHVELAAGDPEAAAEQLAPLPALLRELSIRDPGMLPVELDELEALVACGRLDEAEARLRELAAAAELLRRPRLAVALARGEALLRGALGDLDGAVSAAEGAVPLHDGLPLPVERGRTLLLLGSLERRRRRQARAREVLEEARAVLAGVGADAWVARVDDELSRVGGRVASGALTATEERVAELACEGRPTKEIAAALVVSPKTVEKHLTSIYAKLGVRSRAELVRLRSD